MTIEHFEYRYEPMENDHTRCPHCHMGSGMMSSFQIGRDESTGEIIHSGTRHVCDYCGGTGWLKKCQGCGGIGGVPFYPNDTPAGK